MPKRSAALEWKELVGEVDFGVSVDGVHCPTFYTVGHDAVVKTY